MIGQLLALLVVALVVLLTGMNMLGLVPLLLIPLSALIRAKWLGLAGLFLFWTVSLGTVRGADLTDLPRFAAIAMTLLVPTLALLELVLTPRPYRIERLSLWPLLVTGGLVTVLAFALFTLMRIRNIGVYIGSDPALQVLLLMSLAVLFAGPFTLRTGGGVRPGKGKGVQRGAEGPVTNKNE